MKRFLAGLGSAALLLAGCAQTAPPAPAPPPPPAALKVPPGTQFLYGSGEAAALSEQAFNVLVDAVRRRLASERADPKADRTSAVLAPGATFERPSTLPCGGRPPAAVFDVDETLLLNIGFEYDDAVHPGRPFDDAHWESWEKAGVDKVAPVPGALAALTELRRMGVAVIFNTNRNASSAGFTEAAIDHAGLGPAIHGQTLFLKGDLGSGSGKDTRRAAIAARYCVIAMGGDQLGDFSDLFAAGLGPEARRDAAQAPAIKGMWGRFWFVLPNPVYGSGIKGGLDDIFPADKRWDSAAKP